MTIRKVSIFAGGVLAISSAALADYPGPGDLPTDPTDPTPAVPPANPMEPVPVPEVPVSAPLVVTASPYSYGWYEPSLQSGVGVGVTIGGGVGGFTDAMMRDIMTNNIGGLWSARVSLGTHTPIGIEGTYSGSATALSSIGGLDNGTLYTSGVEGVVRYNVLPHYTWTPYAFGGVGWQRFSVKNARLSQADTGLSASDDLVEFPMGVGFSHRDLTGLVFDFRGTYRRATDSTLLTDENERNARLDSWEASASLGYEF